MDRDEALRRLRERIVSVAASQGMRDAAEDLAQEVLVLLEEKYPQVTTLEELVPLSLQILRFKLVAARRKTYRRGEHSAVSVDDLPVADTRLDPEALAAQREMQERLMRAVATLGERCRELFKLKLQGRSFPEIQRILQANTINTVYTWDARCRQQLLEAMGGRWDQSAKT